jgi:hypothetical protein
MLLEGNSRGLSIFGIGDHNHNIDIAKWQNIKRDTLRLHRKYPDLLVMANCEITFLLGHLLVLVPRRITGTIREGYAFLYRDAICLKILAHPDPATDEWHERFVPDAAGIEVVNGAVFRKAREKGLTVDNILDIPMVYLYARYLSLGFAVAAIGNSDAHALAEMGTGLTGMQLRAPLKLKDVLNVIRQRETFATTDPGIRLSWSMDENTFSWHVEWNPLNPLIPKQHAIEIYCGERKLRTAQTRGSMEIRTDGLYWLGAFNSSAYAVSSPIRRKGTSVSRRSTSMMVPTALLRKPLRDLMSQHLRYSSKPFVSPIKRRSSATIELLSGGNSPLIIDATGRPVRYEVLAPPRERIVIDKSCESPCFDEFFLWLKRNEIHEYGFIELDYHWEDDLFRLKARIVPAIMVMIGDFGSWHRAEADNIRKRITPSTRFELYVRTLFKSTLSLQLEDHSFPLRLSEAEESAQSFLLWHDDHPPGGILARYTTGATVPLPKLTAGDRIFQIFVSPPESNRS